MIISSHMESQFGQEIVKLSTKIVFGTNIVVWAECLMVGSTELYTE